MNNKEIAEENIQSIEHWKDIDNTAYWKNKSTPECKEYPEARKKAKAHKKECEKEWKKLSNKLDHTTFENCKTCDKMDDYGDAVKYYEKNDIW